MSQENGGTDGRHTGTPVVKQGLAQMLKGGVIMDVTNPEQARVAEQAGACAVMALERIPADIIAQVWVHAIATQFAQKQGRPRGRHPG